MFSSLLPSTASTAPQRPQWFCPKTKVLVHGSISGATSADNSWNCNSWHTLRVGNNIRDPQSHRTLKSTTLHFCRRRTFQIQRSTSWRDSDNRLGEKSTTSQSSSSHLATPHLTPLRSQHCRRFRPKHLQHSLSWNRKNPPLKGKTCCQPTLPSFHRRRNRKNQEKNKAQVHFYRTSAYVGNVVNAALLQLQHNDLK